MMTNAINDFVEFYNETMKNINNDYHRLISMTIPIGEITNDTYLAVNQFRNEITEQLDAKHFVYYDTTENHYIKLFILLSNVDFDRVIMDNNILVDGFSIAADQYKLKPNEDNKLVIQPIYAMDEYELMSKVCLIIIGDNYNPMTEVSRAVDIFNSRFIELRMINIEHGESISNHEFIGFLTNFSGMMGFFPLYIRYNKERSNIAVLITQELTNDVVALISTEWVRYYEMLMGKTDTTSTISTLIKQEDFDKVGYDNHAVNIFIIEKIMEYSKWAK